MRHRRTKMVHRRGEDLKNWGDMPLHRREIFVFFGVYFCVLVICRKPRHPPAIRRIFQLQVMKSHLDEQNPE